MPPGRLYLHRHCFGHRHAGAAHCRARRYILCRKHSAGSVRPCCGSSRMQRSGLPLSCLLPIWPECVTAAGWLTFILAASSSSSNSFLCWQADATSSHTTATHTPPALDSRLRSATLPGVSLSSCDILEPSPVLLPPDILLKGLCSQRSQHRLAAGVGCCRQPAAIQLGPTPHQACLGTGPCPHLCTWHCSQHCS